MPRPASISPPCWRPGSNAFHYDHIHVDLMRRGSRRQVCNPVVVPGDVVAARAGYRFSTRRPRHHRLDQAGTKPADLRSRSDATRSTTGCRVRFRERTNLPPP